MFDLREASFRVHDEVPSGILVDGRDYFVAFYEAARRATRSVLLLGWQFDTDVQLLRGDDIPRGMGKGDVELLAFLDTLCRARPSLEVRVVAWDHSVVFALEREPLQKLRFDVATCKRFHFHWDSTTPLGGSHHQKVAIVDGRIAFAGSQDLCHARWDDSSHLAANALRTERNGVAYKPYHEVQAVVGGAAARSLVDLFVDRWRAAVGEELRAEELALGADTPGAARDHDLDVPITVPLPTARVALSRTTADAKEIRELYVRAISAAERLVYIETQYLTSAAIRDALLARMADTSRPRLEIVIMLPKKPEKLKEELTIAIPQAQSLLALVDAAQRRGHALGIYNVASRDKAGADVPTYIHSKLMIVDDTFLTVGSANMTNRSMSLDTELNVAWLASPREVALRNAIRRLRARLLVEHVGREADARLVVPPEGLVARLDRTVDAGASRLRRHRVAEEAPSPLARAVNELANEVLDPADGAEPAAPSPAA